MAASGVPVLGAIIDFSDGATFITNPFTLNSATLGKLDTAQLAVPTDRVDISSLLISASIRRGRNRILDQFQAGTATVVLNDSNGDFNPLNSSGAYYGKLIPLRKIQIFADYNGTRYPLFYGYINSFSTGFANGVAGVSQVTLQCTDGFRLLNNVIISTVAAANAGDTTGARIGQILDLAGWPTAQRSIDTGSSTVQADPGTANRAVLDALQLVADKTEFGGLFCNNQGQMVFYSRGDLGLRAAQPIYSFDDVGVNIGYQGITIAHDDVLIVNDVKVNRLGGAVQEVTDATSISNYFTHSGVRANNLLQTDAEVLSMAQMLLATRKDATVRIESLTLNLFDNSAGATTRVTAGLLIDIFTPITVSKTMPGASNFTETLLVQGISHDITKNSFKTTLMTAEPVIKSFVLDNANVGVLNGTNGLLTY